MRTGHVYAGQYTKKSPSLLVTVFILLFSAFAETLKASTTYEVGFTPGGTVVKLILEVIDSAKSSILVACCSFTNRDIAEALEAAAYRGVKVEIVADDGAAKGKYSQVRIVAAV
jgi:phosphatidylserine/phosphatidylglycerophosphate/cardiolipin synthase-like enzyme